jgi:hypothetical protein
LGPRYLEPASGFLVLLLINQKFYPERGRKGRKRVARSLTNLIFAARTDQLWVTGNLTLLASEWTRNANVKAINTLPHPDPRTQNRPLIHTHHTVSPPRIASSHFWKWSATRARPPPFPSLSWLSCPTHHVAPTKGQCFGRHGC